MDEIESLVSRGRQSLKDEKFDDALGFFEQALFLNQSDPDLWNEKGVVLRCLGRYQEAMECFNKSLEIDPRDKNAS